MNQFEVTINGTTLQLTAEDVAVMSTAMMDAMRTPSEQTFRKGTTGNIYAKVLNDRDLEHVNLSVATLKLFFIRPRRRHAVGHEGTSFKKKIKGLF